MNLRRAGFFPVQQRCIILHMEEEQRDSRTFKLSQEIVDVLCSTDSGTRQAAFLELPDALSRDEVSDVGMQVNLATGADAIKAGRELERDVLFHLGATALFIKQDVVTAESVARELRTKGFDGAIGYLLLKWEIRGVKKDIVNSLTT